MEKVQSAIDRLSHILDVNRFRGIVADTARRAQENQGGGNPSCQYHGVMSGAAHHPVRIASRSGDGLLHLAH